MPQKHFRYNGQVIQFGRSLGYFQADTWATSAAKARSNILYQFKKANNMMPSCKLELEAEVICDE